MELYAGNSLSLIHILMDYTVGSGNQDVPEGIQKIIAAVIKDYSYML